MQFGSRFRRGEGLEVAFKECRKLLHFLFLRNEKVPARPGYAHVEKVEIVAIQAVFIRCLAVDLGTSKGFKLILVIGQNVVQHNGIAFQALDLGHGQDLLLRQKSAKLFLLRAACHHDGKVIRLLFGNAFNKIRGGESHRKGTRLRRHRLGGKHETVHAESGAIEVGKRGDHAGNLGTVAVIVRKFRHVGHVLCIQKILKSCKGKIRRVDHLRSVAHAKEFNRKRTEKGKLRLGKILHLVQYGERIYGNGGRFDGGAREI